MLQGMSKISAFMNESNATRAAALFPKLNIYEQANVILKDVSDSIKRFNNSLGNALDFIDAIPCHDGDYDQMVDDPELPILGENQFYVLNSTFNDFINHLIANVEKGLTLTVAKTEEQALVAFFEIRNGILYINDTIVNLGTYVHNEIEYAIINCKILLGDTYMYLDDIFHAIMQSDEINRVNEYFLKAIAQGNSTLDVILNRINIEFSEAMDETKQYITYISSSLANGVSGYMSLLKTMFKVITTGTFSSSNSKISFTNNSQYVMKNFTSGILDAVSNSFFSTWNATKSIFQSLLAVINVAVTKGYDIISNAFEAILSNYTTSKFNFEANNTNFAIGVIQYTLNKANWDDLPSDSPYPVTFDSLYDALLNSGPLKIKVLWGTMYVWVNTDYSDRIYIEHKLRTDIRSFQCPFKIWVPYNGSNLTQLLACSNSAQIFGVMRLSQQATAQSPIDGDQIIDFTPNNDYPTFYAMINRLQSQIYTTSDIISTGWVEDSEADRAKRIENAYLVLLTCVLWCERYKNTYVPTYLIPSSENLFSYVLNQHPESYNLYASLYTMAWLVARRDSSVNVFKTAFPVSSDTAWSYLTSSSGLTQAGEIKHIYNYTPMSLIQCATILSTIRKNLSNYMLDVKDLARAIQGANDDHPFAQLGEPSKSITSNTIDMPAAFTLYSFVCCLAYSIEYSTINMYNSSYVCGYYGSPYVGDDTVFWAPPNYNRNDLVMGILLIAGIIIGVMLVVSIPTMIIKHKLSVNSTMRAARIENLWSTATKEPTKENILAYRKAVKRNNLQSKLFGGQLFSKSSYWGNPTTNLSDSVLNMSSILYGTEESIKDGNDESIKRICKLITGN